MVEHEFHMNWSRLVSKSDRVDAMYGFKLNEEWVETTKRPTRNFILASILDTQLLLGLLNYVYFILYFL